MWGIQFDSETSNSLVCASASFEIRRYSGPSEYYRVRWHPDIGMEIDKVGSSGWEVLKRNAQPQDLEAILPKRSDFGHDWTYQEFMLAMTFFGEGYQLGFSQGEWHERERLHNKCEKQK